MEKRFFILVCPKLNLNCFYCCFLFPAGHQDAAFQVVARESMSVVALHHGGVGGDV